MDLPLIDYLYQALHSPRGIALQTESPERLRAKLYAERRKDPALQCLSISISRLNPEGELLIVKNEK